MNVDFLIKIALRSKGVHKMVFAIIEHQNTFVVNTSVFGRNGESYSRVIHRHFEDLDLAVNYVMLEMDQRLGEQCWIVDGVSRMDYREIEDFFHRGHDESKGENYSI